MDGLKEQTKGDFARKLKEADCHKRQTEPYSPWMNSAEGCIRELKRGSSRKMLRTRSPKILWDHCIELEAFIRSCTVNDIYETNGETPENIMTGQTADISHICEFGWYDWVMFRDNVQTYPDDKLTLGRYLGPATDVGSALTAKILRANGNFACRSTFRHLTDDELRCELHTRLRSDFDASITDILGRPARDDDFDKDDLTPDFDYYDPNDYDPDMGDVEVQVTPEADDNYIGTQISLPLGGGASREDGLHPANETPMACPLDLLTTTQYLTHGNMWYSLTTAMTRLNLMPIPLLNLCTHNVTQTDTNLTFLTQSSTTDVSTMP